MSFQLATIGGLPVRNEPTCPHCDVDGELDHQVTGASATSIAQLSQYRCVFCSNAWIALDVVSTGE
jgi:hypothetical protein